MRVSHADLSKLMGEQMADTDTMRTSDMGTQGKGVTDKVTETAQQLRDRAADMASQAKDKASEYGRMASEKVDQGRVNAASGLENAADTLRTRAQSGGQAITEFANTAADKLQSTATYMREHDARQMMGDLNEVVRRNPGPSLIAAAAFGFLLGAALRRD